MSGNAELLWLLVLHLVLTALPGVLASFVAVRRGVRSVPVLLGAALAASGTGAMLSFWTYYVDPAAGRTLAFVVTFGSVAGIVWSLLRGGVERAALDQLVRPLALWALGSGFVLFFGFVHRGTEHPILTAQTRYFLTRLPFDNDLPRLFAQWFYVHGHHGTPPPIGGWLASDRPPLQMGYELAQRPFGWDAELHYQVLGVVIQQLWIVGMWAVLCAAGIRPLARGLAIFAAMAGDIAILHGFFVWPKLVAAAFVLAALSMVISEDWARLRRDPGAAVLFASLCGLAMLAHGGSAFAIIALLIVGATRGLPSWRWIGIAALIGIALLAPWSAYQRYADPPGNRLIKWELGGSLGIDRRGALSTIVAGYRAAGVTGTLGNKWDNVVQVIGVGGVGQAGPAVREAVDEARAGHFGRAVSALRVSRFFALLPFLGILLIGPIAMLVARARGTPEGPEWRFALVGLSLCGIACLVWVLVLFGGPGSTAVIHIGSLAVPLLAVCACVVGAVAVAPRMAVALVAVNALAVLALWTPSLSPPPHSTYSPTAGILAALTLTGFGLVALRPARR